MKGICFKPHLHELTVKGIKNQTRQIIVSRTGFFQVCSKDGIVTNIWQTDADEWTGGNPVPVKPRYKVGEVLYLKEPYKKWTRGLSEGRHTSILYKYGEENPCEKIGIEGCSYYTYWKNKLFMPAYAARYFIKVTAVRAERLQDISNEDCAREGIITTDSIAEDSYNPVYENGHNATTRKNATLCIQYDTPQEAYAALIDAINGKGTWDSNPFMWVYDYELINRKEAANETEN